MAGLDWVGGAVGLDARLARLNNALSNPLRAFAFLGYAMSRLGKMPTRFDSVKPAGQRLGAVMRDRYQAREVIEPWRRWYKLAAWQRLRDEVINAAGLTCGKCAGLFLDTSQLVADHKTPHRGDEALFWDRNNLWCLCASCHSRVKQAEERAGL